MGAFSDQATLLVTVIAAGVAAFVGCGSPVTAASAASPSPSPVPTSPVLTLQPGLQTHWKGEPAHWMGPADPQVGVSYPFDLLTHCGISTTHFGGRHWKATTPRGEPSQRPGASGTYSYDGYTTGTMTLLSGDLLRFVITDPQVVGDGESVDFTPLPAAAAPPLPCD